MNSPPHRRIVPSSKVEIAQRRVPLTDLPAGLKNHRDFGVVAAESLEIQRLCLDDFICHPRAIQAANGEFLVFYAAGPMHYGWAKKESRGNVMYVRRSPDGWNWSEPQAAWDVPYSQHAAIPFIPSRSTDLYAFGTEPRHDVYDGEENAAIGWRVSRDHGHTFSPVTLIEPVNAPAFRGMSAMRMTETADGAWLLGSHLGHWSGEGKSRAVLTRQYLLRSADRGASWTLQPGAWPDGWCVKTHNRMDEGRPLHLGENRVLFLIRTPTGVLWEKRSADGGRTWTEAKPTTLAHPDAPPMLFDLGDGTLAVFHHNRNVQGMMSHENRVELWVSLSHDEGHTWAEPRFVIANACEMETLKGWGSGTPMVSYADLIVQGDQLHLFLDHQMRQVLQARFSREDLAALPRRADLI